MSDSIKTRLLWPRFERVRKRLLASYDTKLEPEMKKIKEDYERFHANYLEYIGDPDFGPYDPDKQLWNDYDYHEESLKMIADEYGFAYIAIDASIPDRYSIKFGPKITEIKAIREDIDKFKSAFPEIKPGTEVLNHLEKYNPITLAILAEVHGLVNITCVETTIKFGPKIDDAIERMKHRISVLQKDLETLQQKQQQRRFGELSKFLLT